MERSLTEGLEDGVGLEDLLLHPRGDVGCHTGEGQVESGGRQLLVSAQIQSKSDPAVVDKNTFISLAINQLRAMRVKTRGGEQVRRKAYSLEGGEGVLPMLCCGQNWVCSLPRQQSWWIRLES